MQAQRQSRMVRRTTLSLLFCLAFLCGVGMAHTGRLPLGNLWLLLFVPVLATLRRRSWKTLLWVVLLGLLFGWWRGDAYMAKLARYDVYRTQKVTIQAVAQQDAAYNSRQQLTFDARNVQVLQTGEHLAGKISIGALGVNAVFAGDTVQATGKLATSLGAYQARMSYAQVRIIRHNNTPVNELRRRFSAGMQSTLPEPLASFGMGLLVGQRNNLPPAVSQTLLMVGLTHIIAVSGYNLTIILRSTERLSARRSKRLAAGLALALIGVFLLFAGNSASIVRAAVVSVLSILAAYYGRTFKPLNLLALAAALTAYASPFYIWTDTSWYLSFLAFFGVMVLAPLLSRNWPQRLTESLVAMVALESICAEIMTLPFILHTFGQMSFVGLIANILVVTLVPLAMLLSLVAGLAGVLVPAVAGWLAWPARILMTYMLDVAQLLSRMPHAFVQNISLSLPAMLFWYAVTGALCAALWFKKPSKNVMIIETASEPQRLTPTPAITAAEA